MSAFAVRLIKKPIISSMSQCRSRLFHTLMMRRHPIENLLDTNLPSSILGYRNGNSLDYCTHPQGKFPQITDFPVFMWPNIFKSLKNAFLTNFIITRYFDPEFNIKAFARASKHAVEMVSYCLSTHDLVGLRGLVSSEVIADIRANLNNFSTRAETELAINKDDIILCFPYEIGIIMPDEETTPQTRVVEITMVYHVMKNAHKLNEIVNLKVIPNDGLDRLQILNYRFRRDFTEGVDPEWIINGLNHFKPF